MPLVRPSSVPHTRYRSSSRGARRTGTGGFHDPPKRTPAEIEAAWAHPGGFPLSQVEVGCEYDGTVTNARRSIGIFVNFGAVKDGLLRVPARLRHQFFVGMQVKGMQVVKVDLANHHVVLEPDLSLSLEQENSGIKGRGSVMRRGRSNGRPPRDFDHPGGMPLEEVEEGSIHDNGVVTASCPYGVFIDFGAVKDGRLAFSRSLQPLQRHFKVGDVIPCCQVESVEIQTGKITLGVYDPEDLVAKLDAARTPIEEISVGDYVSGYVNTANSSGIFVNIGTRKDARLSVSRKQGIQMQVGQQLCNMKVISVDPETQFIKLSLPEDDDLDEEPPPRLVRRASSKTKDKAEARVTPKARLRPDSASASRAKARADSSPPTRPRPRPKAASAGKPSAAVGGASRVSGRKQLPPEPEEDGPDTVDSMGLIPLESLMVEQEINGIVKGRSSQGVIVDIGATEYGILLTATKEDDFQQGDQVQGMMIDEVDLKGRQIWLSMEDPELSIADSDADDRPPPPKPQELMVTSKSKAKARPKATEGDARPRQRVGPR